MSADVDDDNDPSGGADLAGRMSVPQRMTYRFLRFAVLVLARTWLRAKIVGRENIPTGRPFILSPVHRSNADTPLASILTTRTMRFMGKESLWKTRAGGWFLTSIGGFPVERGTADRAALRAAQAVLARGEPLVMFPEGTRRSGPIVKSDDMHEGASFVSGRAQVPIVPVGIGGTERIMPKGSKFVYPRKIAFVIGEPLEPPALVNGRVPRRAVRDHSEQLRQRLQTLFDEAQILAG